MVSGAASELSQKKTRQDERQREIDLSGKLLAKQDNAEYHGPDRNLVINEAEETRPGTPDDLDQQ